MYVYICIFICINIDLYMCIYTYICNIAACNATNYVKFACWVFELLPQNKIQVSRHFGIIWREGTNGKFQTHSEALQLHSLHWNQLPLTVLAN